MEWNETARRQTWTTEPVFCPVIMGNSTNMHKWCEKDEMKSNVST